MFTLTANTAWPFSRPATDMLSTMQQFKQKVFHCIPTWSMYCISRRYSSAQQRLISQQGAARAALYRKAGEGWRIGVQGEVALAVQVEQRVSRHICAQHKLLDSVSVAAEQNIQTPA